MIFGGVNRPETQPIYHVAPGAPPALLMTGGRDRLVEPGNSIRLAARLVAAGNAATVLTYRRVGHFIIIAAVAPLLRFLVPVMRDVDAFIAATLRAPRRQASAPTQVFEIASGWPISCRNMLRRTPVPLRRQANRSKLRSWRDRRDQRP
jgi:acetyl esterase/lipase